MRWPCRRALSTALALALSALVASAQETLVVQNRSDGADAARVAAAWGVAPQGPEALAAAGSGPLYYTGPVGRAAHGLVLPGGNARIALNDWLAARQGGDLGETRGRSIVILNTCGTNMGVAAHDLDAPGNWLVAYPLAGGRCQPQDFAQQVIAATQGPAAEWPVALRQAGIGVAQSEAAPANTPASAPVTGIGGLRAVENDSIVIITTLRPTNALSPRLQARPAAAPREMPRPEPAVAALVDGTGQVEGMDNRAVLPQAAGLPAPSIIVGEQAIPRPQVQRGPMGVDFAERARLRAEDARMFERMVAEGAYDPEPAQLAAALQTELARMQCYAAGIDGVWGGDSNAAVQRYFAKAGGTAAASGADIALYRQLILNPDVTCDPVPVAAPAGITFAVDGATKFSISGIDKQQVGQIAANIKRLRKHDPYKGKGIRYAGEQVRRKVGKTGK